MNHPLVSQAELVRRVTEEVARRLGLEAGAAAMAAPVRAQTVERAEAEGRCEIFPEPAPHRTLDRGYVPIGVSARHCHVTPRQVEVLFGPGATLTPMKPLRQPGQFAAQETVTVVGPRGRAIERVRILGPCREETQLELSLTDCIAVGVEAPVRASGDHRDTPGGVVLVGPRGHVAMDRGVIRANRHIHLSLGEAAQLGLADRQRVIVQIDGDRPVMFYDVQVRARADFLSELHIDTDDANAVGLGSGAVARILRTRAEIADCGCLGA